MFRRTFWFSAGAAAGVWATTKVNRKLRQLTPESLAAQAANKAVVAGHRLKDFALDVRVGMRQREAELGDALGIRAQPDPELPAPHRLIALDHTAAPSEPVRRPARHDSARHDPARHESTHRNTDRNEDH